MIARGSTRVTRAGDELALAARELVEDLVALDLADPLEDDLLGRLGADAAVLLAVELLELDDVAGAGVGLRRAGLVDGHLDHRVLDLVDDVARRGRRRSGRSRARPGRRCPPRRRRGGRRPGCPPRAARTRASRETCFSALSWSSAPTKSRLIMCLLLSAARWRQGRRHKETWVGHPRSEAALRCWPKVYTRARGPSIAGGLRTTLETAPLSGAATASTPAAVAAVDVGLEEVDELGDDVRRRGACGRACRRRTPAPPAPRTCPAG